MRNVSDKSCIKNKKNTFYVQRRFFPKIAPFIR